MKYVCKLCSLKRKLFYPRSFWQYIAEIYGANKGMPSLCEACLGILFNVLPKSVPHIASDGVYVLCKTNMLKTVVHSYLNNCLPRRRPLFLPRGLYFHTGRGTFNNNRRTNFAPECPHWDFRISNSLYLSGKNALLTPNWYWITEGSLRYLHL